MKVKRAARQAAKRLFSACLIDGILQPDRAQTVVRTLMDQKPRGYLPILLRFKQLLGLELHRRSALIETAEPLPPDTQAALTADLTRTFGTLYSTQVRIEPALIGGLRIRVGSDVIDGSVQGRLNQLAASLQTS
ncbi:MAG: F0F1 ATP synthase subunit delta [Verrucomicrobiia bacterium]